MVLLYFYPSVKMKATRQSAPLAPVAIRKAARAKKGRKLFTPGWGAAAKWLDIGARVPAQIWTGAGKPSKKARAATMPSGQLRTIDTDTASHTSTIESDDETMVEETPVALPVKRGPYPGSVHGTVVKVAAKKSTVVHQVWSNRRPAVRGLDASTSAAAPGAAWDYGPRCLILITKTATPRNTSRFAEKIIVEEDAYDELKKQLLNSVLQLSPEESDSLSY